MDFITTLQSDTNEPSLLYKGNGNGNEATHSKSYRDVNTEVIYEPKGYAGEYSRLSLNIYKGCVHGCRYCYVPDHTRTDPEMYYNNANPKKQVLSKIERDAKKLSAVNDVPDIHLSFMGDVYQPEEMELGLTREAIEILIQYGLPFTILTKGGTRAIRDFDLLEKYDRASFGTTIVFSKQTDADYWEPGAPTLDDRIRAFQEARSRGIKTWISLEPVIDPNQALELIEYFHPYIDHWKVGKLNHHPKEEERIDWYKFREDVSSLLDKVGADYMLKSSLTEL